MPISSLIVQAREGRVEAVTKRLEAIPELEVSRGQGDQLVVVAEVPTRRQAHDLYDRIGATEEVIALNLIYANFEDPEG